MAAAYALLARWSTLQPEAHQRPDEVRTLLAEVDAGLRDCELRMYAMQARTPDGVANLELDRLLDAAHVLERLRWCALHTAPYVDRPRGP